MLFYVVGDIVFVRRRSTHVPPTQFMEPTASADTELDTKPNNISNNNTNSNSNNTIDADLKRRVHSAGPDRHSRERAQTATKSKHTPAPIALTAAEEQALAEWKLKKKLMEDSRKSSAKRPFYSRAAFSATYVGTTTSAAEHSNSKQQFLIGSNSEPKLRQAKLTGAVAASLQLAESQPQYEVTAGSSQHPSNTSNTANDDSCHIRGFGNSSIEAESTVGNNIVSRFRKDTRVFI